MAPRSQLDLAVDGLRVRLSEVERIYGLTQDDGIADEQTAALELHLQDLQSAWDSSKTIYYNIFASHTAQQRQAHPFFANREFEAAQSNFQDARLKLYVLTKPKNNVQPLNERVHSENGESQLFASAARLSRIDPPEFDGNRAKWVGFKHSFESMVINTRLSKTDKLNYLKRSLTGTVAGILRNLPASSENFDRAWSELVKRYDNPRLLKQAHVFSLVNIRPVTRPNINEYERILNEVQEHLMSLEDLGAKVEAWGELLLSTVMSKFDSGLLEDWERHISHLPQVFLPNESGSVRSETNDPNYAEFKSFVWKRIEAGACRVKISSGSNNEKRSTRAFTSSTACCPKCKKDHWLYACPEFTKLPVGKRFEVVRSLRVCFNCLHQGHTSIKCTSKRTCSKCRRKHNVLIHDDTLSNRRNESRKRHASSERDADVPANKRDRVDPPSA